MTQFVYGGAGGVVETRQCNPLIQLTRLAMQGGSTYNDLEFRYSASQNNGRITQQKDWVTGEEVSYTYDSLNRADHRGDDWAEWGLTFGYDGFGNKTSQTVTKGTGGGVITGDRCGDDPGATYDAIPESVPSRTTRQACLRHADPGTGFSR